MKQISKGRYGNPKYNQGVFKLNLILDWKIMIQLVFRKKMQGKTKHDLIWRSFVMLSIFEANEEFLIFWVKNTEN